ncbi:hypothetical protein CEXT_246641 [Caerostris extrusa]|uniref:Uncharacterized protein n=1 Tax=Caerostris extrusa TaxID=172846 RepID=A0AAV4NT91_CAEEX|nr:hypothetical protein CEXT_246641 [Caerostris extrusa]
MTFKGEEVQSFHNKRLVIHPKPIELLAHCNRFRNAIDEKKTLSSTQQLRTSISVNPKSHNALTVYLLENQSIPGTDIMNDAINDDEKMKHFERKYFWSPVCAELNSEAKSSTPTSPFLQSILLLGGIYDIKYSFWSHIYTIKPARSCKSTPTPPVL